jgi:DNA-directed RNA polymerase specialized sigma24 family protein
MIYIEEGLKNRLIEMKVRWLNGQLTEDELAEFDSIVDEIVIEARRARSDSVRTNEKPEAYLLDLFEKYIEKVVIRFFNKYSEYKKAANDEARELKIKFTETLVFCEWMHYARQITRTIILGDGTRRSDRRKEVEPYIEKFSSSKEKLIDLNFKWVKAQHDEMLGQSGPHKKKGFLKDYKSRDSYDREANRLIEFSKLDSKFVPKNLGNEPGFFFKDAAAIKAAEQGALDMGPGYDPDYFKNKRKDLLLAKVEAKSLIHQWEKGDLQYEFKTREDLIKAIEDDVIGKPLEMLYKEIAETRNRKSNLRHYLNVHLFWRLKDLHKYLQRRNKKVRSIIKDEFQVEKITSDLNGPDPETLENLKEKIKSILTEKQIDIFELHFINRYSAAEIARIKGTSRQNISQIIKRITKSIDRIKKDLDDNN